MRIPSYLQTGEGKCEKRATSDKWAVWGQCPKPLGKNMCLDLTNDYKAWL